MLLNADILFDNLPRTFAGSIAGERSPKLHLGRPLLLEGGTRELKDDHLYVLTARQLPQAPSIGEHVVLVVIGPTPRLRWFEDRCCVIELAAECDFYQVFNTCQRIFDTYEDWNEHLARLLTVDAPVQELIEASRAIFGNDMFVIDAGFRYVAHIGTPKGMVGDELVLGSDKIRQFLDLHELSMYVDEPFVLNLLDTTTLNANLLNDGDYLGCITISYETRPFRQSDKCLIAHLARFVERALMHEPIAPDDTRRSLKHALECLVAQQPLDARGRAIVEDTHGRILCCVRIRLEHRLRQLPTSYLCTLVETAFHHSIAFTYHRTSVVAFIDLSEIVQDDEVERGAWRAQLEEALEPIVASVSASCGVSDPILDLANAQLYFLQASRALEQGTLIEPTVTIHHFQDIALAEMISSATGELPIELFYTDGVRRLLAHDRASKTGYLETLKVYFNCNMSATRASKELFVHRSTFHERIDRIRRLLDDDLDDPDVRLRLQIIIKALDFRAHIKNTGQH